MKKLIAALLLSLVIIVSVSSAPIHFVFSSLRQHPDILWGFVPTYGVAGLGYTGLSLLEGNTTDFQLLAGGGYQNRIVWQDALNGTIWEVDPIIYDVAGADLSLRFVQGFFDSPVDDKDLLSLTVGYNIKYEAALDSMVKGKTKKLPYENEVRSLEYYLGVNYEGAIYPDLNGNHMLLANELFVRLKLDMMHDDIFNNTGFVSYVEAAWGPKAINSSLDGYADYYSLTFNAVGSYTLCQVKSDKMNWFSITAIDRFNANYTSGTAIPKYVEYPTSLGRKVRGFNAYTYNSEFTVVNNFDIRIAGPEMGIHGLAPRVNLFFDLGYGCGKQYNTDHYENNHLASAGAQFTVTFFDFIDLGYQISYLLVGRKYTIGDNRLSTSVTFFLDF